MSIPVIKRPVDGALLMWDLGFKVFPCNPNTRVPAKGIKWKDWALNATRRNVQDYGTANPTANWAVYPEPTGNSVVDVDNKKGKQGSNELTRLQQENSKFPDTITVKTPSGGYHFYFTGAIPSTVDRIAPGVDTKSIGGYVVAPGSRIDDRMYELVAGPVAPADQLPAIPKWFVESIPPHEVPTVEGVIPEGERNSMMTSLAGTLRRRGLNYESILGALRSANEHQSDIPLPDSELIHIASQIVKYEPAQAIAASDFMNTDPLHTFKARDIDATSIPARNWIMQDRYIGGFISGIIAPGGVGKSAITMLDAFAVATGKDLTGSPVTRPGNVWLYNTEDPSDELQRRALAISMHHRIKMRDTPHDIFFSSGQDKPFIIAKTDKDGVVINKDLIDETVQFIRDNNIVLMLADPFVRTHECSENDNMQIDKVVWCFQRIAMRTGCAIGLVHHTSKAGSRPQGSDDTIDMYSSRGATALVNAARICHVLQNMTKAEAKKFRIREEKRRWFVRFDNAKANLQAPAEFAVWFEKHTVELFNGDSVGTVEKVNLIDSQSKRVEATRANERAALGAVLDDFMATASAKSLSEVIQAMLSDTYNPVEFQNVESERAMRRKIESLFETPIITELAQYIKVETSTGRSRIIITKTPKPVELIDDLLA